MPPNTGAWKAFERKIAEVLGGKRRGPSVGGSAGGHNDIIHPHWSAECKLLGAPGYAVILEAVMQAERNAEDETQCPIAFVKRKGASMDNTLCVMRLKTWREWYGTGPEDES